MARQQFTQQITVTAFDVHTVKADLPCQQRALYIPLRERVEVHVCDHNFPAFIQKRVMLRNQRTGNVSFRAAVTARMGQLQDIHRLVLRTILLRRLLRLDAVSIICSSLARPSGTTAQASHQSRPAPPDAKRR